MENINLLAVLASAIVSMIIGSIWYGPLFGKLFMKASGMATWTKEKQEAEKKKMWMSYLIQFVASLVMFYVLAILIGRFDDAINVDRFSTSLMAGIGFDARMVEGFRTALMVWIGFVVPVKLGDAVWGGNKQLFWLSIGNMLLTLLAASAVIVLMQ